MAGSESCMTAIFSLIFSCLFASLATSSDTLRQGNILNSSSYLVSAEKIFTLGFFAPPYSNSSYLGIWFTKAPYPGGPAVWVANRNTPIANNSGALIIDSAGSLIITHGGRKAIEVYRSQTGANITATLSDSGNFIVRDVMKGSILWESFDYPADTLLPGMKLGVNHRTGRSWSLTSWFSPGLPAPGAFTLDWDPSGRRLIVRHRGVIYWTSGILGDKDFEFIKTNPSSLNYKFISVTSKDEEYFTYSILNDSISSPKDPRANISGWWLNFQGDISDARRPPIAQVSFCYGYNPEGGCQLWEQPKCRNSHQKFDLKSGHFGDINKVDKWSTDNNKSLSMSDCRDKCWNDCDCIGFIIGGPGDGTGGPACVFWRGNLKFRQDNSGSLLFVLFSEPPPSQPPSEALSLPPSLPLSEPPHKRRNRIWILIAVAIAVVVVVFGLSCYVRRRKIRIKWEDGMRNKADLTELTAPDGYMDTSELQNDDSNGNDLKVFSFGDVVAATNSFSPENKLGEGGFGPVYKGKLINGTEIAIKRLSGKSGQGVVEFKNELTLIAKLQHVNLVRLLGCCIQGDDKMLIYEYMLNKSLDCFLFDPTRKEQLTWQKRFNIIEGIAQGILYLHKYSRLKIIHRDLKASNILLDDHMNPKISDFGLARIFKQNVLEANTNRVVGTYGYMAPEYAMEGMFSVKSDVFSFGVLMLEIVSGRKNNSFHHCGGPLNLVGYAWELWNKDAALELMDPLLRDSCIEQQLLRCVHVGLLCVEDCAADRPTMSDVVSMLTNDTIALPPPKKPAFVSGSCVDEGDSSKSELEKGSLNGLSITAMHGR